MTKSSGSNEVIRLFMEHRSSVFAFILAIVRDYDMAEGVLQDVSVAVCESSGQFRLGTNFGAWVREIARRRILAQNRLAARLPKSLTEEDWERLEAGFERAETAFGVQDRIRALRRCLKTLTDTARRILHLRFEGRFSYREIASQVGRQPESIRKAVYRSRLALRTCIQHRLNTAEGEA